MKFKSFILGFVVGILVFMLGTFSAFAVKNYSKSFSDVAQDDWFYTPVMELSEKGILNGYADGTFGSSNYITRAETAKLIYSLESRITELENLVEPEETLQEDDENDDEDENNETIVDTEGSNDLTLYFDIDLDTVKDLNDGFETFEEGTQEFLVQYPSQYFWNNTYGGLDEDDGYVWYTAFGLEEFTDLEGEDLSNNEEMSIAIVYEDSIESDREVNIFVPIDDEISFLIEGDMADLAMLEEMAMSLSWSVENEENEDDTENGSEDETETEDMSTPSI